MEQNTQTIVKKSGISFAGLLTVLFIGLKLTGYITWSWFMVLSPLWIGFALILAIMGIVAFVFLIAFLMSLNN